MGASDEQGIERRSGEDRRSSVTEDAFLTTLRAIRKEVREARTEVGVANKRSGWAALFAAFAVAAVLGVAVLGFGLASTVHQQNVDRTNARLGACIQDNKGRAKTRLAIIGGVSIIRQPSASPDIQARTNAFIAAYANQINTLLPDRLCTPAAIDAYYTPTTTTTPRSP